MTFNIGKYANSELIDKLAAKEWYIKVSALIGDLSQVEITIILVVALALLAIFAYRKLGVVPLMALLFLYLIVYVLFQFDLIKVYEERELDKSRHMQSIQDELEKS